MTTFRFVLAVVLWTLFCGMETYDIPFAVVPVVLMAWVGPWRSWREFNAEHTRPIQRTELKAVGVFVAAIVLVVVVIYLLPAQVTAYAAAHKKPMMAMIWLGVVAMLTRSFLKHQEMPEKPEPG